MIIIPKQCNRCVHLWESKPTIVDKKFACAAFHNGIPDAIYSGEYDHNHPYPGDGGIMFSLIQKKGTGQ